MNDTMEEMTARDRRRRERSIWRTGLLVSVLFHLLIFFFWRFTVVPESPMAAAGPGVYTRDVMAAVADAVPAEEGSY